MREHGAAAGRFAEDRDLVGIAAERGDVVLHPLQRGELVHEPVVGPHVVRRLGGQRGMREVSEPAEPEIHADDHDAP